MKTLLTFLVALFAAFSAVAQPVRLNWATTNVSTVVTQIVSAIPSHAATNLVSGASVTNLNLKGSLTRIHGPFAATNGTLVGSFISHGQHTFNGSLLFPNLTDGALMLDAGELSVSPTTPTELGYLSGVTSPIQDQIDAIDAVPSLNGFATNLTVRTGTLLGGVNLIGGTNLARTSVTGLESALDFLTNSVGGGDGIPLLNGKGTNTSFYHFALPAVPVADMENSFLYYHDGLNLMFDWGDGVAFSSDTQPSADFDLRQLRSSTADVVMDWTDGIVFSGPISGVGSDDGNWALATSGGVTTIVLNASSGIVSPAYFGNVGQATNSAGVAIDDLAAAGFTFATGETIVPEETGIIFLDCSFGAEVGATGAVVYPLILTNYPAWRGAKRLNLALGGTGFFYNTNAFYTNGLSWITNNMVAGDTLILSLGSFSINDIIGSVVFGPALTNATLSINAVSNFQHEVRRICADLGITARVLGCTFPKNNTWAELAYNETDPGAYFRYAHLYETWIRTSTNIDYMADFALRLPSMYDPKYWYTDPAHGFFGHPNIEGQHQLADEWDKAARFGGKRHAVHTYASITNVQTRDLNGNLLALIYTNGVHRNLRAGTITTDPGENTPTVLGGRNNSNPALTIQGSPSTTDGPILVVESSNGTDLFSISGDKQFVTASLSTFYLAGSSILQIASSSPDQDMIKLLNVAGAPGRYWGINSRDDGTLGFKDLTTGRGVAYLGTNYFQFGQNGGGTDANGTNFFFLASTGTGTGTGGSFIWQTAGPRASGTTPQARTNQMSLNTSGQLGVAGSVTGTNGFFTPSGVHGDFGYFTNDVSALTFTDRSRAPASLKDAYEIVTSMKSRNGHVDHAALSPKAWGTRTKTVTNTAPRFVKGVRQTTPQIGTAIEPDQNKRDLGMVISAQAMVIQDLLLRLEKLEKKQ